MKSVAITLGSLFTVLSLAGSLQAGGHRRVEMNRRHNEFRIERRAAIQHRRTPLWNIPGHIMIEIDEAINKSANNRAARRGHMATKFRRTMRRRFSSLRFGSKYDRRYDRGYGRRRGRPHCRPTTCKPGRRRGYRW